LPCTWKKYPGKVVSANCLNGNIVRVVAKNSYGAVEKCAAVEGRQCNFLRAATSNLSNCCINAFIAGVNATERTALLSPFEKAFASDDPSKGGCKPVPPTAPRLRPPL
jgi:hypothetical protein